MGNGKHLMLFAVLPLLVRGQKPQVYATPAFKSFFIGDSVYLTCNTTENSVIWYKNDQQIDQLKTWNIKINSAESERYYCETSGGKSDVFSINAKAAPDPRPKLSIETGRSVMWVGGAVILKLEHGDRLQGWKCWVCRDGRKPNMVQLRLKDTDNSIAFQTADLHDSETIYWCTDGNRNQRSNQIILRTSGNWNVEEEGGVRVGVLVGLVLGLVGLVLVLVGGLLIRRKRTATGLYEEVAMKSRKQGDDKYETLQKASGREREYDTLNPGASGSQAKSGEYEALKKEGMKEGVYHTLGVEGAAGGEGGYEALKKEGMKEGEYHTLGVAGAAGGEGGYEALKKEGMKEGEYHTLGVAGAAGGEGGYEALKKAGMKEGEYHTIGVAGAAGGEGGYEALKKAGMKEGIYHTLSVEGAAGGEGVIAESQ
ncbi:uncharacterized protein LOC115798373 [Archocentrus centrarchus]|uniref:uncharacterized protein LOC115798373 n=1 Tax=Archocentrus centrarchus TaxID=63155 RepID=UPI0011EA08D6|nr:uncharacterized protein LOC115798373 [Archocentrus centrarchus]